MNIRIFLLLAIVVLTACDTSKQVVRSKPRVVVVKEEKPKVTQIEQIEKTYKPTTNNTVNYIRKFAPIAIKKMQEHNIPASITLAQGILESGSGRSPLAVRSNNHFGIKCHKGWQGKSVTHDDDEKGECFRKYKYPESSYEDHSQFLLTRKRYAHLFKYKSTDYKAWAYGLKRAGYATDKRYPNKLIALIKKYQLYKYDYAKITQNTISVKKKFYQVKKGDTLYSIAKKHNITVSYLREENNLESNAISIGQKLIVK